MSETSIQWTHYTFNPWWGCTRVSPGCEHCYAETFAHRLGLNVWGATAGRRFFDDHHWNEPLRWQRRREKGDPRHLVFCASMADVFEDDRRLDEQRARLWALIEATPALTWQILTKRPRNADKLTPGRWVLKGWPANVWALTTAEDQQRADERIPALLRIPARVHGVSYEPALGDVKFDWKGWLCGICPTCGAMAAHGRAYRGPCDCGGEVVGIDWLIVGGESGPHARPFDVAWARSVVRQCREAGTACFVKQMGSNWRETSPNGDPGLIQWKTEDPKGGDPAEWPADLRVREFPSVGGEGRA